MVESDRLHPLAQPAEVVEVRADRGAEGSGLGFRNRGHATGVLRRAAKRYPHLIRPALAPGGRIPRYARRAWIARSGRPVLAAASFVERRMTRRSSSTDHSLARGDETRGGETPRVCRRLRTAATDRPVMATTSATVRVRTSWSSRAVHRPPGVPGLAGGSEASLRGRPGPLTFGRTTTSRPNQSIVCPLAGAGRDLRSPFTSCP